MGTMIELAILVPPALGGPPPVPVAVVDSDLLGKRVERHNPEFSPNPLKMHLCKPPVDLVSSWRIWVVDVSAGMHLESA